MSCSSYWVHLQYGLLAFLSVLLVVILMGTIGSALGYSLDTGLLPCPLCYLQRSAMMVVGIAALLNVRLGSRPGHDALMLLAALVGGAVSIRQILLHLCPGFPTYDARVLGLGLYTWAFLVFVGTILFVIIHLTLLDAVPDRAPAIKNKMYTTVEILFGLLILVNLAEVVWQCGWGPCQDV